MSKRESVALRELDFQYSVDTESDRSSCDCSDSICRCTRISHAHVESARIKHVAANIIENLGQKLDEIDQYCIERLCAVHKLYEPDSWEVDIRDGYYGDETGKVTMSRNIADKLEEDVKLVVSEKALKDKILFVLVSEYGYELPALQKASFEVAKVNMSDVVFGQIDHYRKVDRDALKYYKDYEGIFGVVMADGEGYRVIDGYNRLAVAKAQDKRSVKVIVANG